MNYSWAIVKLSTRDVTNADGVSLTDAVVEIKWRRIGVDADGVTSKVVGHTDVYADNVAQADFTPFADLTEAQVIGWLESNISADQIAKYDSKIAKNINSIGKVEKGVPWS